MYVKSCDILSLYVSEGPEEGNIMKTVEIKVANNRLYVGTPYNPAWILGCKMLGGRWDRGTISWIFDSRDEERVRSLCKKIFGTDGTDSKVVTVRINAHQWWRASGKGSKIWFAGREIAGRMSRDSEVYLGEGVILIEGSFPSRGGSMRYPSVDPDSNIILEVRDVPAGHTDIQVGGVEIVEVTEGVDFDALRAERERLMTRLAEINNILSPGQ